MKRYFNKYGLIIIYLSLVSISGFNTGIKYLRYLYIPAGVLLLFLFRSELTKILKKKKIIFFYFPFVIWAFLTSIWSYETNISAMRSLLLLVVVSFGLIMGIIWSEKFDNLLLFIPVNIIIVTLSILSVITNIPANNYLTIDVSAFRGFMFHPNTLSSIIVFTLPALFYEIFFKDTLKISYKVFISLLVILNLFLLVLTYSRAGILSVLILIFFAFAVFDFRKFILFSVIILILTGASFWFFPSVKNYIYFNYYLKGTGSLLQTRHKLFVDSYQAAKNGGMTGVGFGMSDTSIVNPVYSNPLEKIREKGNGILALIEETGITGLFLFFLPALYVFYLWMNKKIFLSGKEKYLLIVFGSFLVHAQFEGWFTGVGIFSLSYFYIYNGIFIKGLRNNFGREK